MQGMALAPEDPELLLEAGNHYLARARTSFGITELEKKDHWLEKAEGYFRTCLEKNLRRDVQTYLGLGDTQWERSKKEEAVAVGETGIRLATPTSSLLNSQLVEYWLREGTLANSQFRLGAMERTSRAQYSLVMNHLTGDL